MTEQTSPARTMASPCPWCGPGTRLTLRSDGMGGQSLWCQTCGCKGPSVQIAGDFDAADDATIERWSRRSATAPTGTPDLSMQFRSSLSYLALVHSGAIPEDAAVSIPIRDIRTLVAAAGLELSLR